MTLTEGGNVQPGQKDRDNCDRNAKKGRERVSQTRRDVMVVALSAVLSLVLALTVSPAGTEAFESAGVLPRSGGAPGWSEPEVISGSQAGVWNSDTVVDSRGCAHAVYGMSPHASINYVTNESGSWSSPAVVSPSTGTYSTSHLPLAIDRNDKLHLVYKKAPYESVLYQSKERLGSWSEPVNIGGARL